MKKLIGAIPKEERILSSDTLIFKFGDFIEEKNVAANYRIEKIDYSTTGCYGTCPIFEMSIDSNRTASYVATRFNKKQGKFKATLDSFNYGQLINLLNYIDFEKLNSNYSVGWTDDQRCYLKITYDNGKTKTINDYGLIGTFGLSRVYQLLFNLRENQSWQ